MDYTKSNTKQKMKTISFFNRKGGVGKTSISFLFSRYLANTGHRVLQLDLDPQRTLTNHFLRLEGIKLSNLQDKTIFEVILEKIGINEAIIKSKHLSVSIIPGSFDLSEIQSNISNFAIKDILEPIRNDFDYCICDNAPNWSSLIQSSLFISDKIIIPTLCAIEDFEQTQWSLSKTKKVTDAERNILLNQFNGEKISRNDQELLDLFSEVFEGHLLKSSIPNSNLVRRYTLRGENITDAKGKAKFLSHFTSFVNEIIGKEVKATVF